jgi:hypothetical protein
MRSWLPNQPKRHASSTTRKLRYYRQQLFERPVPGKSSSHRQSPLVERCRQCRQIPQRKLRSHTSLSLTYSGWYGRPSRTAAWNTDASAAIRAGSGMAPLSICSVSHHED